MPDQRAKLTYDDYAALPDDGRRYQVLDGELVMTPSPSVRHQEIIGNLFKLIDAHVRKQRLGKVCLSPVDCLLGKWTVLVPDVAFVETARSSILTRRAIEGAPTLVIEVLSPSSKSIDRKKKRALYAEHGVPHYWIVDPDALTLEALTLAGADYGPPETLAGLEASGTLDPFPDLVIVLRDVFAE
jgi:Uma2 family endonuclease